MAQNTGKYKLSAEGRRAHNTLCGDLKLISRSSEKEAGLQYTAGDEKGAAESMYIAGAAAADAKHLGCRWAQ